MKIKPSLLYRLYAIAQPETTIRVMRLPELRNDKALVKQILEEELHTGHFDYTLTREKCDGVVHLLMQGDSILGWSCAEYVNWQILARDFYGPEIIRSPTDPNVRFNRKSFEPDTRFFVVGVFVRPSARSNGLARKLVASMVADIKQRDKTAKILTASEKPLPLLTNISDYVIRT